jgi:uncharacterized protein YndB with AHSA1/START domain
MPKVSVSRLIAAPPEDVWPVLADVENARRWNTAWSQIEITSLQKHGIGTTFRARTETGDSFQFQITEWAPLQYIEFSPLRDEREATSGITLESHAFRLLEVPGKGTHVELVARAATSGIRGRIVGLLFWPGYQKHGLSAALDALQALFEPRDETEGEADGLTADE